MNAQIDTRVAAAWRALSAVEDPEIPALSIVDLGLVRKVAIEADGVLHVLLTPTYTGCPATDVIRRMVEAALNDVDTGRYVVTPVLAPPWTSDWITEEGRAKLAAYGIVPPTRAPAPASRQLHDERPCACPRCGSEETACVSQFGSTPCKALHRCSVCLEPFEVFKCI